MTWCVNSQGCRTLLECRYRHHRSLPDPLEETISLRESGAQPIARMIAVNCSLEGVIDPSELNMSRQPGKASKNGLSRPQRLNGCRTASNGHRVTPR